MNTRSKTPTFDEHFCQICSSVSSISGHKRLSCFSCDHCHLSMCYECFEKHTNQIIGEFSQLQKHFSQLTNLFHNKQQSLALFQEQCIRTVNSTFDEVLTDLQNLRKESIDYIKQQFNNSEVIISNMITSIKPIIAKSQQNWTRDGIRNNVMVEFEIQRKQINDIEHRLDIFSSPTMHFKISTFPRNKLDLHCQLLVNSYTSTDKFAPPYSGKIISVQCLSGQCMEYEADKIDVNTEIEELGDTFSLTKQTQTDIFMQSNHNTDDDDEEDDYFSVQDETSELSNRINTEHCLSTRYISQDTILTKNEVDRLASDGEHLLYFSETSKSLCYVTNISTIKQTNRTAITKEITCRWPHYPILDLVYSPVSSQFICATKTGIYTCTVDSNNDDSTIDIKMQLTQHWSYVRLSADKNFLWIWIDIPRLSQLRIYSPKTFDCIKSFNLNDYPRFSDNSTSFCIHTNLIATLFQFKQPINVITYKKNFHLTFCDSADLHELFTIRLGECDIDHEIRVNYDGIFFITNGKRKLWIVDRHGKKEYVKLNHIGRALTIHTKYQILIANGTQQLQCVELFHKDD